MPTTSRKVKSRDIPSCLRALESGDPRAQQHVLESLCPCRSPRYDKHVWEAIFRAYHFASSGLVRDQAGHAVQALMERARTDPRSQELLRWLSDQGVSTLPLEAAIPVWRPRPRFTEDGIYIPRPERAHRSRANRRR